MDCLKVKGGLPNYAGDDYNSASGMTVNSKGKQRPRLQLRLGDFWFLQNPRRIGCEYSQGRGDWGNPLTAPPETLGFLPGPTVTDRSDIWAMGIVAFYWACGGYYPDANLLQQAQLKGVEAFKSRLPLCWGSWLPSLLLMCLNRLPSCRASAEHICSFLIKTKHKK